MLTIFNTGLIGIVTAVLSTATTATGSPSDDLFRAAYEDRFTSSQPFVQITVIDGNTGHEKLGCVPIGSLTGAITLENGWPFDPAHRAAVEEKLFSAENHRFIFRKAEALAASGYPVMAQYERACDLLRAGIPAYMEDRTGHIAAGRPHT